MRKTVIALLASVVAAAGLLASCAGMGGFAYYDESRPHHAREGFRNKYQNWEKPDFWKWQWERWRAGVPKPPREPVPRAEPEAAFLQANATEPTLTWLGHATVLLQVGSYNILTDPHLTERASRLRGRTAGDRSKLLYVVGGAAVSLGFALVLLGYSGASHTIYVFEQIPYLISGGILGGSLVVAGGFCYFAFWLTRMHAEMARTRASNERLEALLQQLVDK